MLIIDNISIQYKTRKKTLPVIQNLSLEIKQGEALVILGPSGCGKSTLVNALAKTIPIESGKIDYIIENNRQAIDLDNRQAIDKNSQQAIDKNSQQSINQSNRQVLDPRIHKIGLIPQNCGLLPWKTVKENCLLPLKIRKESISENQREKIMQIYEALKITDLIDKYPKELSGGEVQRAAIARAFILQPDILLMDEPFSALDEITREEARELFLNVWKQVKPTTILVTHSIVEALYLGNTIMVMGNHMGDVKYQMQNPYLGELSPKNAEYLVTQNLLREKLKVQEEGEHLYE